MHRVSQSDEEVVDKARRVLVANRKMRWGVLLYAVMFLGVSGYFTVVGVRKIENLDTEQLRMGFVYGLALAVVWTSFGVLGAICLGKFLVGFSRDFRPQELLVRYHDRLRDLGQLSDERGGEPGATGNSRRAGQSSKFMKLEHHHCRPRPFPAAVPELGR
jgi:hypothetical protein